MENLFEYQITHCEQLIQSIDQEKRALDASDTGTGKTYVAAALCKTKNLHPIVICPKSVIPDWITVLKSTQVMPYSIANYELIKNCRHYSGYDTTPTRSPFITRRKKEGTGIVVVSKSGAKKKKKTKWMYTWNFPRNSILIFDESHRCKNVKTINSELLFTATHYNVPILMLSATACDTPENFKLFGYVLGLYDSLSKGIDYIKQLSEGEFHPMKGVHDKIFPKFASRMRKSSLAGIFPENTVIAKCYDMQCAGELQEQYKIIENAVNRLQREEDLSTGLAVIVKARMRIEMLKVPTFVKFAKEEREKNNSVAIFVNFTQTLLTLSEQLDTTCLIYGQQTMDTRTANIKAYNEDKERIIICNTKAGGVGVSLHDQIGNHKRISIISPSWSAQDVLQALGRIHRANGKTEVKQHIIYCKGTVEESICKNMCEKIGNIAALNDGEMKDYQIDGLTANKTENNGVPTLDDTENKDPLTMAYIKQWNLMRTSWRLDSEMKQCQKELKIVAEELKLLESQR